MDDQTFDILFNAITIATVVALLVTLMRAGLNATPPTKECKPHKWSIHPATEKLTCTECSYVAGTNKTDTGQY